MIIKLDWFNCKAVPEWEAQIHYMLEKASAAKQISVASVRVEEVSGSEQQYHLTTMLRMPGPDVIAHGDGPTFDEAMQKMSVKILHHLQTQAANANELKTTIK